MAPSMLEAGTAADAILLGGPPRAWTGGTPFTQMWPGMLKRCKDYMLRYVKENPGVDHCMLMFEMHRVKRTDPVRPLNMHLKMEYSTELICGPRSKQEGTSYHVQAPGYSYLAAVAG